jgi:hypothetical protein
MTQWIGFTNPKDVFVDKEEFEFFKWIAELFNAQDVRVVH